MNKLSKQEQQLVFKNYKRLDNANNELKPLTKEGKKPLVDIEYYTVWKARKELMPEGEMKQAFEECERRETMGYPI